VEVAGEGLDGGPPLVALLAFLEGHRLRHEEIDPDESLRSRAEDSVELDPVLEGREGLIGPQVGHGADEVEILRTSAELLPGENEELSTRARGEPQGLCLRRPAHHEGERRGGEEADVLER
jgi:hypothetical protein